MEKRLSLSDKKIEIFGGVAVILLIAMIASWWLLSPTWKPVLGQAGTPEMRHEMINYLMENNIAYREEESTGFILVEQTEVGRVRTALSSLGVLSDQSPGFEIFDEAEYGMSEFTQRINFQRAIEAEIASTIRSFADVRSARVHLSIPKESLFKDKQHPPKASVVIRTRPGQELDRSSVEGVVKLVSASVEGLSSDNVIVLDERGKVLSQQDSERQLRSETSDSDFEAEYAKKAKKLVVSIAQTDEVEVAVSSELNFDRVRSVKEEIIPSSEESGGYVLKTRQQNSTSPDISKTGSATRSDSVLEEEYVFTKERSEIEHATGKINLISVGIVINKSLSEAVIADIERVVSSGLGLNEKRGDRISVVAVASEKEDQNVFLLQESLLEEPTTMVEKTTVTNSLSSYFTLEKNLSTLVMLGAIAALFLLLLISLAYRRKSNNEPVLLSQEEREKLLAATKAWLDETKSRSGA